MSRRRSQRRPAPGTPRPAGHDAPALTHPQPPAADDRRPGLGTAAASQDGGAPVLLLTVEEAAAALGIGRTKTYELIATGELEAVHIGRCRHVPVDAVGAYITGLRTTRS